MQRKLPFVAFICFLHRKLPGLFLRPILLHSKSNFPFYNIIQIYLFISSTAGILCNDTAFLLFGGF